MEFKIKYFSQSISTSYKNSSTLQIKCENTNTANDYFHYQAFNTTRQNGFYNIRDYTLPQGEFYNMKDCTPQIYPSI